MPARYVSYAVMAAIVSSVVSIAVSSIFLGVAILLWLVDCWKSRSLRLQGPPFTPLLVVFWCTVLISIAFSADVLDSLLYLKKLVKFLYVFLIFTYLSRLQVEQTLRGIFVGLGASALYGVLQYYWLMDVNLVNRIRGFMGHWMTFSGQLMMGIIGLMAYLLLHRVRGAGGAGNPRLVRWRESLFWLALIGLMLVSLLFSLTRNAWLGTVLGLFVVLAICRFRWGVAAAVAALLVFLVLPSQFQERVYSAFNRQDTTTRIRLELLQTGKNMIAEHLWTGVGPRRVPSMSKQYRLTNEFPEWIYQHLHNDVLQVTAELGLIGLAAWLAWWVRLFWDLGRFTREGRRLGGDSLSYALSIAGIGIMAAFISSGLFEYNFGDSEKLILLLFFVTAPYVVNRQHKAA